MKNAKDLTVEEAMRLRKLHADLRRRLAKATADKPKPDPDRYVPASIKQLDSELKKVRKRRPRRVA